MIRNIKVLGLAVFAVAAMGIATASVAQASEFHATIAQKAVLTGIQHVQNAFQLTAPTGPKVTCAQTTLEGTIETTQGTGTQVTEQEATVTATHSGCLVFGLAATVNMNGCKDTLTGTGQPALSSLVDIAGCTAGKGGISIQTPICQITVPEQNGLSKVTYANVAGAPHTVTAQIVVASVTYKLFGAGCGHTTGVHTTDGAYTGAFHIQAYEDNKPPDQVTKHNHQYNELTHGNAVGLLAT